MAASDTVGDPNIGARLADMQEDLPSRVLEALVRSVIEDGSVEVSDRPVEDILGDCRAIASQIVKDETGIHATIDHRDKLLSRAQSEAREGDRQIAITLFALWIEHTVNGCLQTGLIRKGYPDEVIDPLIRELKLKTKVTALWHVAGFAPISESHVRLIGQIAELRNSFVHYKWRGYDEATHETMNARVDSLNLQAIELQPVFDSIMNKLHWNGRKEEIIAYYRADFEHNVRESGPLPLTEQRSPTDPAPPSPSSR